VVLDRGLMVPYPIVILLNISLQQLTQMCYMCSKPWRLCGFYN